MLSIRQLELSFESALGEAAEVPEEADVLALWTAFEGQIGNLPQREQLQLAGAMLSDLAGLCEAKAEILWEDWQDAHNTDGPVMGDDWLSGLTRQSQELDFSGLVSRSYETRANPEARLEPAESLAGDADKANVLAMLEAIEAGELKAQALAVSHSENISEWVAAVSSAMASGESQRLVDIQSQLQMPMVEVWIAALLGGFRLEQRGRFYESQGVWITVGARRTQP